MNKDFLLGFDIGGTKCAVILGQKTGDGVKIMIRESFATPQGPGPTLALYATRAKHLLANLKINHSRLLGLGISCGGPLESKKGVVLGPPNLPGWNRVPIVSYFKRKFGLPVYLENDANACAVAEWLWGSGKGSRNMVFLTFGTGMGAGLILDKKLYRGTNDLAGEVGAVRLAESGPVGYNLAGSFEGFCSGGGIGRLAQLALQKNPDKKTVLTPDSLSAQAVFEAVRSGDELAEEVVAECAKYLGRGLAVIVNMLNPQKIVIGSIFIRQKKLLWPIAEAELKKDAIPMSLKACKIVSAKLGEQVGDYASLAVAMTAGKV